MGRVQEEVSVRVPASTSNLGSGFDTLGLAVDRFTEVRVAKVLGKADGSMEGDGRFGLVEMTEAAARAFFRKAGLGEYGVRIDLGGDVPGGRGLGYSATVRVGVIAALNELSGAGWERQRVLELATDLEGHPDNASPSVRGGLTVSGRVGERVRCIRFNVSRRLKLVTLIPAFGISTEEARQRMPAQYTRADAAHGLNRAALITAAFASGDLEALKGLFDDRFHQPYREPLVPELGGVVRAGVEAGALGGFLSGSGSAIICLAVEKVREVGSAMQAVMPGAALEVLGVRNRGYEILKKKGCA